jgi:hypothetical protein
MSSKHVIECLNRSFQDICNNKNPFGGKVVCFGGDFRQCLPILPRGTTNQILNLCITNTSFWSSVKIFKLTKNMRLENENEMIEIIDETGNSQNISWNEFLLKIGEGKIHTSNNSYIQIPNALLMQNDYSMDDKNKIVKWLFPNLQNLKANQKEISQNIILTTKNEDVLEINKHILELFPGMESNYYSIDTLEMETQSTNTMYPPEFIQKLTPNGMPPHELKLKNGIPLILLRNIDPSNGLANGTRFILKNSTPRMLTVEIITEGPFKGNIEFIPRIPIVTNDDKRQPCKFKRLQFPLRICFAMTINKSQGQTLEKVALLLKEHVFAHGQLYVALSRVRSPKNIKLFIEDGSLEGKSGVHTKNIVFNNIFQ